MFVRVKKIGKYEYLYLVENVREGGRHVQRAVKSLGRREQVEASGMLDALAASAARHSRRTVVLSAYYRGELDEVRRASIGPDLIFGRLWAETGCLDVLRRLAGERRFGFDLERAVYATVLHRLMVSGSDRHGHAWRAGYRVPGAESISLRQAYKAMAWLGEPLADEADRVVKDRVEEELFAARRDLFGQVSVAFYDTTSLYFEGRGGARLGRRGHSKDHRPQLNQVVLGVVLDDADRPICSFLWPGNTADVTTLMPVVERLRERFAITGVCVVADRGMVSRATIAAFEERGIGYILGVRERGDREVRDHVLRDDGAEVPLSIPRQKAPATQLAVKEVKVAGRRYVVCRNEERAAQDAQARAAILEGLQKRLAQGDKALLANTGYRRYLKAPEGEGFSIDEAKVAADAQYDGVFVLRTNTRLSPLQVALRYRNLLAVEDLFRSAKSLIDTRPIFHQSDRAIRGHIFCSFLALVLRKELYDRLRAAGQTVPEWNRIVCDLQDLSEVVVVQNGRRAKLRTAPGPTIDPICRALGLSLPPTFQEMPPEDPSETCGA
jgi:hypothetical protein